MHEHGTGLMAWVGEGVSELPARDGGLETARLDGVGWDGLREGEEVGLRAGASVLEEWRGGGAHEMDGTGAGRFEGGGGVPEVRVRWVLRRRRCAWCAGKSGFEMAGRP